MIYLNKVLRKIKAYIENFLSRKSLYLHGHFALSVKVTLFIEFVG